MESRPAGSVSVDEASVQTRGWGVGGERGLGTSRAVSWAPYSETATIALREGSPLRLKSEGAGSGAGHRQGHASSSCWLVAPASGSLSSFYLDSASTLAEACVCSQL